MIRTGVILFISIVIGLALISVFQLSHATSNPLADATFDQTIKADSFRYELHCLRKKREAAIIMGSSGRDSENVNYQILWHEKQMYQITVIKEEDTLRVKVSTLGQLRAHYLVPFEFNFDTTMDLLQFNMLQDEELKFLTNISCRLAPRIYNFTHTLAAPLVIGVHTEIKYFSLASTSWFNELMQNFPESPRLITRDTDLLGPGQSYTDSSYLEREASKPSIIVVGHKDPTDYKLSPGGWLLFKFAPTSSNIVIMSGGFLNMCMSNTMVQIAAAFLSSDKESIHVKISNLNSYAQDWGMTNALTLPIGKGAFPLWLLKEREPEAYEQLFKGMKQYLEIMTKHQMEVVFNQDDPITDKPVFRISILPN